MVLYTWLREIGLKMDAGWYHKFYRMVVLDNEWFPGTLPTHSVLYWYTKALNNNLMALEGPGPEDHRKAINTWLLSEVPGLKIQCTYRDLLFQQIADCTDVMPIDIDAEKDFSHLIVKKRVAKRKEQHQSTINQRELL